VKDAPTASSMTTSQLIAHLNGLTVGNLESLTTRIDTAVNACRGLGHEEIAGLLDEARRGLERGDLKTFRKRVETAVARLGHRR